jgi:hypothetical protein
MVEKGVVNGPITGIDKQRAVAFKGVQLERQRQHE